MCLAIPGKLISVEHGNDDARRSGRVEFGGIRREVSLAFTPEAKPGNFVLVHVGFALSIVDEDEAQRIFADLKRMGELADLEEPPS